MEIIADLTALPLLFSQGMPKQNPGQDCSQQLGLESLSATGLESLSLLPEVLIADG